MRRMLHTSRLRLREATPDDAPFLLALMSEAGWRANIGTHEVNTVVDAEAWLRSRYLPAYENGPGLRLAELADTGDVVGLCGLVERDWLDVPDLGFALLEAYQGRGLAREAAQGVIDFARDSLHLERLAAVTTPGNTPSIRVLGAIGFEPLREVQDPVTGAALILHEARIGVGVVYS